MAQLEWIRDPGRLTLSHAMSAAYRYGIRVTDDGRAALAVRHAHAGLDAEPVKTFTYKTVPAARNGAQRFEDKHGYDEVHLSACADHADLLSDLRWLLSDVAHEHWQNCDNEGCYICEGYEQIKARWNDTED